MAKRIKITKVTIDAILSKYARGMSVTDIARGEHRDSATVREILSKAGITVRDRRASPPPETDFTPEQKAEVHSLWRASVPQTRIAKRLNIPLTRIMAWSKEWRANGL